jgi:hypothetical protein
MNPIIAGILISPLVNIKAKIPPIKANGKLRRITAL